MKPNTRMRLTRFLAALGLVSCVTAGAAGQSRWPTTVDLNPGETITARRDGAAHTFRILNDADGQPAITYDSMPFPTTSVEHRVNYAARVRLEVNGQEIEVVARPFQYPVEAAGLRLYLDGTQEWLAAGPYPVSLPKRIRLRFTAAGESWGPATLRFPVGDYRWGATNGWLEVDLGRPATVSRAIISEGWDRVRRFVLQARIGGTWQPVTTGTTLGMFRNLSFEPVRAQVFRLSIAEATDVPALWEFQLFPPTKEPLP